MRDVVFDATVVVPWFDTRRTSSTDAVRRLRADFEAGALAIAAPSLLFLEVLNVAGRQWGWEESALADLASELQAIGFEISDPALPLVAGWVARGLTAFDATYLALAEARAVPLVTSDLQMLAIGRGIAQSAASAVEG